MTTVLWLGESGCDDSATVGGKVANLSRLAAAYPVPDGFCVPVTAFGDRASSVLPAPLAARIVDAYRRLGDGEEETEPRVAVRSSAVDEDGDAASFAGQHETYLNITGPASATNFSNNGTVTVASGQSFAMNYATNGSAGLVMINGTANVGDFVSNGRLAVNPGGTLTNTQGTISFGGGSVTNIGIYNPSNGQVTPGGIINCQGRRAPA